MEQSKYSIIEMEGDQNRTIMKEMKGIRKRINNKKNSRKGLHGGKGKWPNVQVYKPPTYTFIYRII